MWHVLTDMYCSSVISYSTGHPAFLFDKLGKPSLKLSFSIKFYTHKYHVDTMKLCLPHWKSLIHHRILQPNKIKQSKKLIVKHEKLRL